MSHYEGYTRVLIHNAGWCPPCNDELSALSKEVHVFNNDPVTFISLSGNGWRHGSAPDTQFLKEWKEKHNIPFVVAANPSDFGGTYLKPPLYIPNIAIIGKDGKLAYKRTSPGVSKIFEEVRKTLAAEDEFPIVHPILNP